MATPILATKLYIPPPRPTTVARPHLLRQLDEGLHRKLTLISAPAGFGKTTLLSSWATHCERPVAWLSLDENDSDPRRFLTYLVTALQTIEPKLGAGVLQALRAVQPPATEALVTILLNDITAFPTHFLLVLDDYHSIKDKAIDDPLRGLLEHLPPQMHLVIATREDPQLPLARLRARGQMTELRAADLRFSTVEAANFLTGVMSLNLSAQDIALLETRTEGWIVGLQLAALSMRGRADSARFIQAFTGSHRFVLDYLVEEVLQRQPEHVRSFLLQTAILERLSGSLCNAVTGREDGSGMLNALERSNLFVVPLDDERCWYRYHHLFAEVLQARLLEEHPDQVPILHQRASAWYERHGQSSKAIDHALAAEDVGRAAGLIELSARTMLTDRQEDTFIAWLNALPDRLVRTRPVLSGYYALALVSYDLEAAEDRLQDAERLLEQAPHRGEQATSPAAEVVVVDQQEFRSLPGITAIIRAYHAGALGDVQASVRYAQRALELLPEGDLLWHGAAAALLGLAHWRSGDLKAAYRYFADGMARLRKTSDTSQEPSGAFILANLKTAQGHLREAARFYQQALQRATSQGKPTPPGTADLYVGLSEIHCEQGELDRAFAHLMKAKELGAKGSISENRYRWYVAMARLKEVQQDLSGALELLDSAERSYIRSPDPYLRPVAALKTGVWLRQGRLSEALGWVRERQLSVNDELSYLREFEHLTLARVLIAQYQSDRAHSNIHDAIELLDRLLHAADKGERGGSVLEILVLQALAHWAQGNLSAALAPLARALTLAEPEGYLRIFLNEGKPVAQLLSALASRGIRPNYVSRLLAAVNAEEPTNKDRSYPPSAPSAQSLIEPLSQRELDVLKLIAEGLSNREISQRLFRALSTIKGQNRIIFDKLQVKNRTEAVARARELKLL